MDVAVLVPVKAFRAAKQRLSPVLSADERRRLATWMAERVLVAAGEAPVYVACDDDEVRRWAAERGATVLWGPGLGLNGAVDDGVARIAAAGHDHVVISHADVPLAVDLPGCATPGRTTLVPDRRRDGTNVMAVPAHASIAAGYGAGSFRRHLGRAMRLHPVEVRASHALSFDVDRPDDLAHPALQEVLPAWLPTIPASRSRRR